MNFTRMLGRGAIAAIGAAALLGVAASSAAARGVTFGVQINQATGQVDPTATSPILFDVTFTSATADFATGDVSLSGTAGATTATVTPIGDGIHFTVSVSGMTSTGSVVASVPAGVAHNSLGQENSASTSEDNTVQYTGTPDTTSTTTTTVAPTTSTTTTLAPTTTGAATTTTVAPVLPVTGSKTRTGSAVAVLLVAAGAGLLLLARRRGQPTS